MTTCKRLLGCVTAMLALSGWAQASEFLRVCEASWAKRETFLGECRTHARRFQRDFYPGGHGPPIPEHHALWFDTTTSGSHFALGCALGLKDEVRFLGIYFLVQPANLSIANTAPFTFIDFQGNTGLRRADGGQTTFLAIHRFTPPGRQRNFRDGNCENVEFNESANQTIARYGPNFISYQLNDGEPVEIARCSNRTEFEPGKCSKSTYRSFFNTTTSSIIYAEHGLMLTAQGRMFIRENLVVRFCDERRRPALEFLQVIAEVCGH